MKQLLLLAMAPLFLHAQADPASEAYKAWDLQHRESDHTSRAQSLFEVSAEWVAKWPDSRWAWIQRRQSLLDTQNRSAELWKQVDENLIRLSPPRTFASVAAYDWVANDTNVKDGEALIASEIEWLDARSRPPLPPQPSLADLVDDAQFGSRLFSPLCTLATAQIKMKEFDRAHATIARIRSWLDGDFKIHFDQDPLETFPDYEAKDYTLSAELAQAEGRNVDALAFLQKVITNPYYRRVYPGNKKELTLAGPNWEARKKAGPPFPAFQRFRRAFPKEFSECHSSHGPPSITNCQGSTSQASVPKHGPTRTWKVRSPWFIYGRPGAGPAGPTLRGFRRFTMQRKIEATFSLSL